MKQKQSRVQAVLSSSNGKAFVWLLSVRSVGFAGRCKHTLLCVSCGRCLCGESLDISERKKSGGRGSRQREYRLRMLLNWNPFNVGLA